MTLLNEIHAKRELVLASAKKHGVKDVRVFGSVARGEETEDSDIDFLINIEKPVVNAFGFLHFQNDMNELFEHDIDIVFESGIYHLLRPIILNEARPI